jgi:hypothetical protein
VDGQPVIVDGRLQTASEDALRDRVREVWRATSSRMGVETR